MIEWGQRTAGGLVFPSYVPYVTNFRNALFGGELTTASPPGAPDLFITLDDDGDDIILPTGSKWEVGASFFISVTASSTAFWSAPEYSVFGGPWTPLTSPVIKPLGLADATSNETGIGEFRVIAPVDIGVKFRWSFARNSGPAGSEVTVESGYAWAVRTGSL